MTESPERPAEETIDLKDPVLAGVLAWLVPGLGHWYQGRRGKALVYFFSIVGIFVYGLYLSSSKEPCMDGKGMIGYGRAVYFSWRDGDLRLPYLCQIGVRVAGLARHRASVSDEQPRAGVVGRIDGPAAIAHVGCRRP